MAGSVEQRERERIERVAVAVYFRRGRKLIVSPDYADRLRSIGCHMHLFEIKDQ